MSFINPDSVYRYPEKILQQLIRFNTTNPPGNEMACIEYINQILKQNGFETLLLAKDPNRPNLIARLKGENQAPPLLLYGHVDVVTTEKQTWQHPPFEGIIKDGYVWGRGALDMKGMVAMMLAAILKAKAKGLKPAGDIVFAALSDEEAGGHFGAKFLAEHHPERFSGIRYAIGEFGCFSMYIGKHKFYPIQVAEKQACWFEAKIKGPGGHGALPVKNGAMAKMAELINQLNKKSLPPHITPVPRQMIQAIASALPIPSGLILRQLLNPMLTGKILKLLGDQGSTFKPHLYNTINPTIIRGGEKINVIPSEITIQFDGRILPGYTPKDMFNEIRQVVGDEASFDIMHYDPCPAQPDMGMFALLADIVRKADPEGIPIQMLLPGVTDARFFSKLNIQTYGFAPMNLPPDFDFFKTIHAADERIPVDAIHFGTDTIYKLLQRYGDSSLMAS